MTNTERWDVVLKVLDGPMSSLGEMVKRGPIIRVGANPGPGGLQLVGYRGLDARQCVITAYSGGTASVAPVGNNQVRVAPHANVRWKDIDPVADPVFLTDGCAIHLGPVGRGATLEFLRCQKFGTWEKGILQSEAAAPAPGPAAMSSGSPALPQSYDARRVGKVQASSAPFWFLGCSMMMTSVATVGVVLLGLGLWLQRSVAALGPEVEGYEFYESVEVNTADLDLSKLEGLHKPFMKFVMAPNIDAAGDARKGLDKPENWDQKLLLYTSASFEQHLKAWAVFRRLEAIRNEYAQVTVLLRGAGLPEVLAAVPYQESRYNSDWQSAVCAKGYWQFMPEVALRVERQGGLDFRVRDCRFEGASDVRWSPSLLAPPVNVRRNADYIEGDRCVITGCDVDDRLDLLKSTKAALFTLGEAWKDPVLRKSGAAVQITIASHNAGYDDRRFGNKTRTNLLPAFEAWASKYGEQRAPHFIGENLLAPTHDHPDWAGSAFPAETQHYVYPILAQHFLAVCYYAKNYPEERAFREWLEHVGKDGYCNGFRIPGAADVRAHRGGKG